MCRNQRGHAFPDMSYRACSLDTTIGGRPRARWSSPRPAFSGSAGRAGSHPLCFKRRRACLNSRQRRRMARPADRAPGHCHLDAYTLPRATNSRLDVPPCALRGADIRSSTVRASSTDAETGCTAGAILVATVRSSPSLYGARRQVSLLDGAGGRDGRFSSLVTRQAPVNAVDVFYNNRPRTESSTALRSRCLRGSRQFREQNVANLCRN